MFSAFLRGVGTDFQSLHHKIHQSLPTLKVQVGRQGFQVLKESAPRPHGGANQSVALIGQFQQGVQAKGQQVHCRQEAGEMLFAVTEVVFQMIAPVFEHVVVFVFNLPARPAGSHQPGHVVGAEEPVGDVTVAVKHRALGVGDGQLAPVDLQGIGSLSQRHAVGPLIVVIFPAVALAFDPRFEGVQVAAFFQGVHPFGQIGVGVGFAGEEKMEVMQQHLPAEGLMGVKIVAQQRVVAGGVTLGVGGQPAFGGGDFAVLFLVSVLRRDEFGPQRQDLGMAGAHNDRSDGAVVISQLPVGMLDARAIGAVKVLGTEIPGGIQRDKTGAANGPHGLKHPRLIEGFVQIVKKTEEMAGFNRIEHLADVVVAGNVLDLEKGAGVVASPGLFHPLLVAQKGGALSEKDAEGREGDVAHRVNAVVAGAAVWQGGGNRMQALDELIESTRIHVATMSVRASLYKLQLCDNCNN